MSTVSAILFYGFKLHQPSAGMICPLLKDDEDGYAAAVIESRLVDIGAIDPENRSRESYGARLAKIEAACFHCSMYEAGYYDAEDTTTYLIIDESKRSASSEFSAAHDYLFEDLPKDSDWNERLLAFCTKFGIQYRPPNWVLTLKR